jgi:uncharacterized protein YraI
MKRLLLSLILLFISTMPVLAQDNEVITLDDATPAVDVVISLPPDTNGTIGLNFDAASIKLADADHTTVFSAADPRLHALELNIAPNTGPHTLIVERLAGAPEAHVSILSLPELPIPGAPLLVQGVQLTLNQEVSLPLDAAHPGDSVEVHIPSDTTGLISTSFPGASATTQLVDAQGVVIIESYSGHVDGMNVVIDGGDYDFTVLASNLVNRITTGVRAVPADQNGFIPLQVPVSAAPAQSLEAVCVASIAVNSVNLRSGPGTGYSVIDYGYRDENYFVGGVNPQNNWVVVGLDSGSAWLSESVVRLNGGCGQLPIFDVPLRDAQPAPIIVVTPEPQIIIQSSSSGSSSSSSSHDDDHEEDHDEDEHEDEREDDDD